MGKLNGKIALVTGGAQGIGLSIARSFLKEGATVVVADIDQSSHSKTNPFGPHGEYIHLDVTQPRDWERAFAHIDRAYDGLDILVNNAGISPRGSILETDYDLWIQVQRINSDGCFLGCKFATDYMKDRQGGVIVNMSSIVPLRGGGDLIAYSASKASVAALTRSVAMSCGPMGIRCNSVHPGGVETRMLKDYLSRAGNFEDAKRAMQLRYPLRRWGQPEDVAKAVLFLSCEDSSWITGVQLVVDGGATL